MNIRVDLTTPITDGTEVVFRSPVDCSQITGLIVYYNGDSKEFALADAHGNNVGDIDHLFAENVVVKVILDVTHAMAYVQNADTNAYIESTFVKSVNGVKPDKTGNVYNPCPYIVTIEPNEDGTYTADATPEEISAQHGDQAIACDYLGYLLPLKLISDVNYYFSGIVDTTSFHVVVRPDGSAGVQQRTLAQESEVPKHTLRYTPQDLTPEQRSQALTNLGLDELPTGGSSNVFSITEETTEALTSFTIQLPTTFDNIYILNVHITFGTIEQTFKLHFHYGNGDWKSHDITAEMEAGSGDAVGLNLFSVRYGDKARFALNGISNSYYYAALPSLSGNMSGRTKAGGTKNNLWFGTNSDSLFIPAGTKFNVWGLRK